MQTITTEGHELTVSLEASIDDVVNLIAEDGTEYLFGTHAAVFESDVHDLYILQNGYTGDIESDAYNPHDVAEDAAKLGLKVNED